MDGLALGLVLAFFVGSGLIINGLEKLRNL
jgi:hypothetical protein